jgi:hypothetical protein
VWARLDQAAFLTLFDCPKHGLSATHRGKKFTQRITLSEKDAILAA